MCQKKIQDLIHVPRRLCEKYMVLTHAPRGRILKSSCRYALWACTLALLNSKVASSCHEGDKCQVFCFECWAPCKIILHRQSASRAVVLCNYNMVLLLSVIRREINLDHYGRCASTCFRANGSLDSICFSKGETSSSIMFWQAYGLALETKRQSVSSSILGLFTLQTAAVTDGSGGI